jgi:hypothetical protein
MNNIEQYRKRFSMLIESSLGDVRPYPLINEAQMDANQFKSKLQKFASESDCFSEEKCPTLYNILKGMVQGQTALISAAITVAGVFFGQTWIIPLSGSAALLTAGTSIESIVKAAKSDSKLSKELENLWDCFTSW